VHRITITIDGTLIDGIDQLIAQRGYQNRSEAIRDLVRAGIAHTTPSSAGAPHCVASLVYVYEHGTRELPKRLQNAFRDHHHLSVATMRVSLDHETCMEVSVLKGRTAEVQNFASHVIAERGVKHGQVAIIPAEIENEHHAHGHGRPRTHQHVRVR
jgi:CopG family nickel-responsive transcriptional regulator